MKQSSQDVIILLRLISENVLWVYMLLGQQDATTTRNIVAVQLSVQFPELLHTAMKAQYRFYFLLIKEHKHSIL